MKHTISTLVIVTLVSIASLTQAHAQNHSARVNVPFAFNCGAQHFAAGTYIVKMQGSDNLAISNVAQPGAVFALVESRSDSSELNAKASLTFRKYGSTYFLAEYSTGGADLSLFESSKERSLAHEYAISQMPSSLVQVAALEPSK
jgi:hypothetical protein